jgi:hypothetical protein
MGNGNSADIKLRLIRVEPDTLRWCIQEQAINALRAGH